MSAPSPGRGRRAVRNGGRPLIVLCAGDACEKRVADTAEHARNRLRAVIRGTTGSVLVSAGCLRRCSSAAVALVGWQAGAGLATLDPLVFAGVHQREVVDALADWITGHQHPPARSPFDTLPLPLRAHLVTPERQAERN